MSPLDLSLRKQAKEENLLYEISQRIRQSLDLQTIFDTACHEIRGVLQADRVGIFRFDPDSGFDDGEFVAESVVDGFSSVLKRPVHDHCFGDSYASLYAKGRYFAVDDIYAQDLQPCHLEILGEFQVRANLVMPLLCNDALWGLLCIHQCADARHWASSEVDFTHRLANQLAIGIQQASLYEQVQAELIIRTQTEQKLQRRAQQEKLLSAITQRIRASLQLDAILTATVEEIHQLLQADRVLVYRVFSDETGSAIAESVGADYQSILGQTFAEEVFPREVYDAYLQGKIYALEDRTDPNQDISPCLVDFLASFQVRAKLVVPIVLSDTLWGLLIAHQCDRPRHWDQWNIDLLSRIADQLAIAIQQSSLFTQLQQELIDRQKAQKELSEKNKQLAISNKELAQATRQKDEFLANMSHELRTPLNGILGMTEGLQEGVFGPLNPEQKSTLQHIERSGSHLLELINDILDLAKIEAGHIELNYSYASILSLCQTSLEFIKPQALKKGLEIDIQIPFTLPDLYVDERRIRQVLINLLMNAVKFTPEGGRITLTVSRQPISEGHDESGEYLKLSVEDTGIGIEPQHLNGLFQPFVQIDSSLNRKYTGTGLGLSLVKQITELHGGRCEVTSEIKVGSCFSIFLPTTPDVQAPQGSSSLNSSVRTPKKHAPSASFTESPLILLAEDNETNRITFSSYLQAKGYRMTMARDGGEAIAKVQSDHPDLILMDIQMPGMDGLEAMTKIRAIPAFQTIPIIALTSLAMDGDRDRCMAVGANAYLSKPIKLKNLVIEIQTLLAAVSSQGV